MSHHALSFLPRSLHSLAKVPLFSGLSRPSRTLCLGLGLGAGLLPACVNHGLVDVELGKEAQLSDPLPLDVNRQVDILFVVDHSWSMGEEQANLAANFSAFIDVLEAEDVKADYRIAITTTELSGSGCSASPADASELGSFVASSCQDRAEDFVTEAGPGLDMFDVACADRCPFSTEELGHRPTQLSADGEARTRPWLERSEGLSNFDPAISTQQLFSCLGPMGVDGCGTEQPLEAMFQALDRARSDDADEAGFLRDDALLAVVVLTDEVDCSYQDPSIFDFGGDQVFFESTLPTSAICWNAGVECEGEGEAYESCVAANYDAQGNPGASDADAVLQPLARYIAQLEGIEAKKKESRPDSELIFATIVGVDAEGIAHYGESSDEAFNADFGIGAGCVGEGEGQTAVPPVRLLEMAQHFQIEEERVAHSICESDYSPALESIADQIRQQIQPACYGACARDADPSTPDFLDVSCRVFEELPGGGDRLQVPECAKDDQGTEDPSDDLYLFEEERFVMPSEDANACYVVKRDIDKSTVDERDDMDQKCVERGHNLEFELQRRPGFPAQPGASVEAACELAEFAQVSCPGL